MIKHVLSKEEYIHSADVEKLDVLGAPPSPVKTVKLFGKQVELYDDPWMWHVHLKCTDLCNAKCDFCIEKSCKFADNPGRFIKNADKLLSEMEKQGVLYSVSLTGGEPTVFPAFYTLGAMLKTHDIKFLTMNTNGFKLADRLDLTDELFDWYDVSRHRLTDEGNFEVFKAKVPSIDELRKIRENSKKTKMRIQCVMSPEGVFSPEKMLEFVKVYDFADDFSFRRLMKVGSEFGLDYQIDESKYSEILEWCFANFEFVEQTIQDYYVYEIYKMPNSKTVTFSYSNMKMLRELEHVESDSKIREFIVHPNGLVSGSWKMDAKILLK